MIKEVVKVIDIEANNLLQNLLDFSKLPYRLKDEAKLWCVVVRDVNTDKVDKITIKDGISKDWFERVFSDTTEIVAHNGIKFDFIFLKLMGLLDYEVGYLGKPDKLFGRDVKITDTLIRSRLFNPDRYGGHSLENWGKILGEFKTDFRSKSIEIGLIKKTDVKGAEFSLYSDLMLEYCEQDTKVTALAYKKLKEEYDSYAGWEKAEKLENKLADLAIRRESYGFWFDKDLAIQCLEDLTVKMEELENRVNPILPKKALNKTKLKLYTPPAKQFKQDGELNAHMINFIKKHDMVLVGENKYSFEGIVYDLPITSPIKMFEEASISDLDHVKEHLISLGWIPTEWKVRDLTKDSKKQNLKFEKRVEALDRWLDQTFDDGRYKNLRLEELGMGASKSLIRSKLIDKLKKDRPVRVPTSPSVRVGIEKDLCPNLEKLGDKVSFAKDFTLYLTYKHRKSSIAGGDIEDMDFDDEYPNSGYLSMYREEDGRVPTPAIEIGASTNRYRHIGVCNVARASSIYGKEMRSLFGCGAGMLQLGFDFSSLEARIQGHYVIPFGGEELAEQLLASKPNDIHSINAKKLGIIRDFAKSISYMLMYGGSAARARAMLGITMEEAKALVEAYWEAVPSLKRLKDAVSKVWKQRGSKYVVGIDGRKIITRSEHSLLNALFQSGGVINAKYTTVHTFDILESNGYKCNPFEDSELDACGMIEYHDENQMAVNPKHIKLKTFKCEEEMNDFISNWNGGQLGSPVETKDGGLCIALPNIVSEAVIEAIKLAEKDTNLNVELGIEWVVHKNYRLR